MTRLDLVNVSEAARRTGRPRTTIASWVRRGLLHPAGLDVDGTPLYDLAKIQALAYTAGGSVVPSDLERFRDHARRMAAQPEVNVDAITQGATRATTSAPTLRERRLWRQLADEIDNYLNTNSDRADDTGLFDNEEMMNE